MGVFDDKKFEELDWISQATEPMESDLNEVLGVIPDEVNVDFNLYKKMVGDSYSLDLEIQRVISYLAREYAPRFSLSWEDKDALIPCFEIQMGECINLDFERQIIDGELKIVKIQSTMDEKILEGLLGREGIQAVSSMYINNSGMSRANEVMELLGGCESGLRTRSPSKKRVIIKQRLMAIFKANEWKIKDTTLANKVGRWIVQYVNDGNLAAWSNFCRLKVMTHKDQPIYSMEEVE